MQDKERMEFQILVEQLMHQSMDNKINDFDTLTTIDKLACRCLSSMNPLWMRWSYYIECTMFGGTLESDNGAFKKYYEWSFANCKPIIDGA